MTWVERLKKAMSDKGINPYRIERDLHISEGTIRAWLRGDISSPTADLLSQVCNYIGVNVIWILEGKEEYAPSFRDDVQKISEKLEAYGERHPEKLKKAIKLIEQMLLFGEDEVQPLHKKARRKSV
ncbi:MAG: helix-turn-helix transcriptional regulator [Nitrospirae bacterium]|nr:helix-turn-helix transcriptional regulator [Nitrospirota bacterium]